MACLGGAGLLDPLSPHGPARVAVAMGAVAGFVADLAPAREALAVRSWRLSAVRAANGPAEPPGRVSSPAWD